jgi:pyruvate kinase
MKNTKVLCTIGPASESEEILAQMLHHGMNAARINTSHGTFEQYEKIIHTLRRLAPIPIVMDTQGPKVRLRMVRDLTLTANDTLRVGFTPEDVFYLDASIYAELHVGDHVVIDDGGFDAVIEEKEGHTLLFRFRNGGHLVNGKAVNFPNRSLPLAPLTDKDIQSLQFAKKMHVDYIALSFTRSKSDIMACRSYLSDSNVKIIAKIENQQGIDNFDEIVEHADGIMVARGDMGVEIPAYQLPIVQKKLIHACCANEKLVITATQMLQSMISAPRPTRAEVSDVANAILDGTDVIMLSAETSVGLYPVQAVSMMDKIAQASEPSISIDLPSSQRNTETAICDSVRAICRDTQINKIITITRRGRTAKMISRLRLQHPILAFTAEESTYRELHLYYGVQPVLYENLAASISTIAAGLHLLQNNRVTKNDKLLFISGEFNPAHQITNTIQVLSMQDIIEFAKTESRL